MRRVGRSSAALVLLAAALAGCYAPGAETSPVASGSPLVSPKSSGQLAGSPEEVVGCPNYVTVVETGPMPTDFAEDGPVARDQQRLEGDITAMQAYAASHADEFGSIRYENGPRVRIVVAFTAHLAEHCAALRSMLEYPEEFELIWQQHTEEDRLAIMEEIVAVARARDLMRTVGLGTTHINVQLRADGEALAAELTQRYGDIVAIGVGLLPYPDPFVAEVVDCGQLHPLITDSPFRVTAVLDATELHVGEDFSGTVTVTNTGSETVEFETGRPHTAIVYVPGSDQAVGMYDGGVSGTGTGSSIAPGGSFDMDMIGGTASCDPALGYALPPGSYDVRVPVAQYTFTDGPTAISYLLSEPVTFTIVP